ncbi:hypothetical protein ACUH7Y_16795 [Clostridium beijerinckii]|uniref:tRNA splicing endonuclease n=2 Tax=Clostridium TaxID=1485 RepID=A0A1S8SV33_CLOBE|nr:MULTISPECIES: hypothetical protein [Clostridium]MBA8934162.1 tRNA splicing endonuclease [Clostridium beijerinckii]MBN7577063.1 hypothetical protein [Clostridium beijerinckii]MBN7582066.1 hypothetical protein [Clostridium beijerinckii]MBN7586844.1 hypothetical protein [Clostridium beijerinckii]MBO0523049.1 hypothetical protein [Clostridium beijerinckii]
MGNIIKINMYAEMKRKRNNKLNLTTIEKVILEYNNWIKNTNREDKIESYEKFLHTK